MYHKLYEGVEHGKNEYQPFTVNWWDVLVEMNNGNNKQ